MSVQPAATAACPCCGTQTDPVPGPSYTPCTCCGHRWRSPQAATLPGYYQNLVARNDPQAPWFRRKIVDRLQALSSLLEHGGVARVLEVGCAEGDLGAAVKARFALEYEGVELSRDRELAGHKLDRVFPTPAGQVEAAPYQLIASFHVLEHIAQPEQELAAWSRLLAADGRILVEVPNRSGHPLLADDQNPEHLHQFSTASLTALLARCGFDCQALSTGHYESPVYPDSIRVLAQRRLAADDQRSQLLGRFRDGFGGPFVVYGIGGDFLNYIAPLADALQIQALLDSSPGKWGQCIAGHVVRAYDPELDGQLPVLVCSIRFGAQIRQHLLELGIGSERIVGLETLYECGT